MHYSQQRSSLELQPEAAGVLQVQGTGIMSRDLVREQLRRYLTTPREQRRGVLIDLRNVAGYGYGCAAMAQRALREAAASGTTRIALVSSSAVLRTMTAVLDVDAGVALRCFSDPAPARAWLEGRNVRS